MFSVNVKSCKTNEIFSHLSNNLQVKLQAVTCMQAQLYPAFCEPIDCSPPGSCVHGISQARILQRVVISSPRGSFWFRDLTHSSCISTQMLYHWATWEAQAVTEAIEILKKVKLTRKKKVGFTKENISDTNELWVEESLGFLQLCQKWVKLHLCLCIAVSIFFMSA